jgi:cytosine deaminase
VLISTLRNARTLERPGGCDLVIDGGRVAAVHAAGNAPATAHDFDLMGHVVLPATVDAHVHLDKAFLRAPSDPFSEPLLPVAIAAVAGLRRLLTADATAANAARAVETLVRRGTTAARAHVEVDVDIDIDLLALHRDLACRSAGRLHLQLVAFPQRGLESPGMPAALAAAMAAGCDVVGGCPYVDEDPVAHIDAVFALAERHGAPVDFHLDFSDDAGSSLVALVAERTLAHGMQGHVTIGHVTTLAAMTVAQQSTAFAQLAAADIALVILPTTDLYLAGHGQPGTRSVAPLERAIAAGVRTAIGNNNIANPFSPFGNGNSLQAAWLTGLVQRASGAVQHRQLLDAITTTPARILGLPPRGTRPGDVADLVVVDATDPATAVLEAPHALATIAAGQVVAQVVSPLRQPATA